MRVIFWLTTLTSLLDVSHALFDGKLDILFNGGVGCTLSLLLLDFDLAAYDRYGEFFRDDSVMTLAQAGNYYGVQGIKEYVQFYDSATAIQYLTNDPDIVDEKREILGYNEGNGQCEFLTAYKNRYQVDPTITEKEATVEYTVMAKVFVKTSGFGGWPNPFRLFFGWFLGSGDSSYVARANIYLTHVGYMFDDLLNTASARSFVCAVLATSCDGIIPAQSDCVNRLASLPTTRDGRFDNDSQGCRFLHATLASANPQLHCAHVALEPTADPNGNIKCSVSDNIQVSSLFSDSDISFFNGYSSEVGIDPSLGFQEL